MKFLEVNITRGTELILKAKSETIAKYVQNLSIANYGEAKIFEVPAEYGWGAWKAYKIASQISGFSVALTSEIMGGGTPVCPWLTHKDLATGIEIKIGIPCSSEIIKKYANAIEASAKNLYTQSFEPFELAFTIDVPEEVPDV